MVAFVIGRGGPGPRCMELAYNNNGHHFAQLEKFGACTTHVCLYSTPETSVLALLIFTSAQPGTFGSNACSRSRIGPPRLQIRLPSPHQYDLPRDRFWELLLSYPHKAIAGTGTGMDNRVHHKVNQTSRTAPAAIAMSTELTHDGRSWGPRVFLGDLEACLWSAYCGQFVFPNSEQTKKACRGAKPSIGRNVLAGMPQMHSEFLIDRVQIRTPGP